MTPDEIEAKFSDHEKRLIASNLQMTAILNLLKTGAEMLVDMEVKINALIDSQTRLYAAQQRTEEALRKFIERTTPPNGHNS